MPWAERHTFVNFSLQTFAKRPASGESTHQACCKMLGLRDGLFEGNTAIPAVFGLNNVGLSFTNASLRALSLGGRSSAFTPINSPDDDQETNYAVYVAPAPVAAGAMEVTDTVTIHAYQYGYGGFADVHLGYRGVTGDPVSTLHVSLRQPSRWRHPR